MPRAKPKVQETPQCAHRFAELEEYVGMLQGHLNLYQWQITVVRDASDVEAWADIAPHSQAQTADLRISHDFWSQPAERQREVLVHELVHLVTCRADQLVENLELTLGKIAWSAFELQYEDAAERSVDHVARVVAQSVPLPEFRK
tara:strand:- start:3125 stop:3559 length:435 start_codon:yes stop_codon:yes gene_type:complete